MNDVFDYEPKPTSEFRSAERPSKGYPKVASPRMVNTRYGAKPVDDIMIQPIKKSQSRFYPHESEIKTSVVHKKKMDF